MFVPDRNVKLCKIILTPPKEMSPVQQTKEAKSFATIAISLHPLVISISPLDNPNASRPSNPNKVKSFSIKELPTFKNPTEYAISINI